MAMSVTYATVNGRLMMENRGGVKTAYVSDTLGNLIQCRDASGNKTYEAFYWSYGEIRASTGSNPSPWGFVGLLGYYTDALNYLYVRARYYRPNLTRWQTVDPLWPMLRKYEYCLGSPNNYADPSGLIPYKACCCLKKALDASIDVGAVGGIAAIIACVICVILSAGFCLTLCGLTLIGVILGALFQLIRTFRECMSDPDQCIPPKCKPVFNDCGPTKMPTSGRLN